ncbi:MAG: dihydroorotate dehydrogenase electron transfer subunit [bacterium]|nr:dihydroorotate dehydrogenase electron transfer subunit [bacterium]
MKILKNEKINENVFLLVVEDNKIARTAKPGQFVQVRLNEPSPFILRRPFSIHYVEESTFHILYKVVGDGTKVLSAYTPGNDIDVLGPLGNGFELNKDDTSNYYKNVLLVAGGIGIAPLYFAAKKIKESGGTVNTLIGAANKNEILCKENFEKLGSVSVSTEDGSDGIKGLVTDLLKGAPKPEIMYVCGPAPMLKAIQSYASTHFIPCQLSLEQYMACGIGICLGCAVPIKNGYKYVCKDGPVFWSDEVKL